MLDFHENSSFGFRLNPSFIANVTITSASSFYIFNQLLNYIQKYDAVVQMNFRRHALCLRSVIFRLCTTYLPTFGLFIVDSTPFLHSIHAKLLYDPFSSPFKSRLPGQIYLLQPKTQIIYQSVKRISTVVGRVGGVIAPFSFH